MAGFTCPYCQMVMPETNDTVRSRFPSFESQNGSMVYASSNVSAKSTTFDSSCVEIKFYKCPNCGKFTVFALGKGDEVSTINTIIQPISQAKQFPDYVPESIRKDYEEACAIVELSPKASATLSRRCLQGMIQDYWNIKKGSLLEEINALKDLVPAQQWKVLNCLRRLGNIGAHPESDVNLIIDIEPDDAKKLISVIELLIKEWYIDRHEQQELYKEIEQEDKAAKNKRSAN